MAEVDQYSVVYTTLSHAGPAVAHGAHGGPELREGGHGGGAQPATAVSRRPVGMAAHSGRETAGVIDALLTRPGGR